MSRFLDNLKLTLVRGLICRSRTVPLTKMKLSLVPVHTQTAAAQQCVDVLAVDLDQHLRHLLRSQIPDEGS